MRTEGRLKRSDSQSNVPPTHISNKPLPRSLRSSQTKFTLSSTSNTETSLTEASKTLLSTLKTSISDNTGLHSTLSSNIDLIKEYKATASVFKAESLKTLTDIKEVRLDDIAKKSPVSVQENNLQYN